MNKVPSAEEFATEYDSMRMPSGVSYQKEIAELMIEFAKIHVEAALKQASYETNYDSLRADIINSYPLDLIK
jgi:hypothetical protein